MVQHLLIHVFIIMYKQHTQTALNTHGLEALA